MRHEETQLHCRVQPFQFYMCSDSKVGSYQLIGQPFTSNMYNNPGVVINSIAIEVWLHHTMMRSVARDS